MYIWIVQSLQRIDTDSFTTVVIIISIFALLSQGVSEGCGRVECDDCDAIARADCCGKTRGDIS